MHRQFNLHDAKTHLSRLVQDAADGHEVVIAKAGQPIARLVAYQPQTRPRKPGLWRGQVQIDADFDALPSGMATAFRGETD